MGREQSPPSHRQAPISEPAAVALPELGYFDETAPGAELLSRTGDMLGSGPVVVRAPADMDEELAEQGATLIEAAARGPADARKAAVALEDVGGVLLFCIPENWHTPETLELCRRLSEDDAASVLTWLSLVFHQGHSVGFRDGQQALAARAMADAAE